MLLFTNIALPSVFIRASGCLSPEVSLRQGLCLLPGVSPLVGSFAFRQGFCLSPFMKIVSSKNYTSDNFGSRIRHTLPRQLRPWSRLELKVLETLVKKHGQDWEKIAKHMPGRKAGECCIQYYSMPLYHRELLRDEAENIHTKDIKKTFSEEDCKLIDDLIRKYGCRWSLISSQFPSKTPELIETFVYENLNRFPALLTLSDKLTKSKSWSDSEMELLDNLFNRYCCNNNSISQRSRLSGSASRLLLHHQHKLSTLHNVKSSRWIKISSPWTERETRLLNDLVEQYGNDWSLISSRLPGRTAYVCKDKYHSCWQQSLNKSELVKHSWPQEVVQFLDLLISKYGKWQIIPIILPGISPMNRHVRNTTLTRGWKEEEISLLKELVKKYGRNWKKIKSYFPHKQIKTIEFHVRTNPQLYYIEGQENEVDLYEIQQHFYVKRPWSGEETRKLLELKSQYGTDWRKISEGLPGRLPSGCYYKYKMMTGVFMKVEKDWNFEDIIQVQDLVQKYGSDWEFISQKMQHKSPNEIQQLVNENFQIFSYPTSSLNSNTEKTVSEPWSDEDILKLTNLIELHGNDWKKIAENFPEKTLEECVNYYNSHRSIFPDLNPFSTDNWALPDRSGKSWTEKEVQLLKELLGEYGVDYHRISKFIPGRTCASIRSYVDWHRQDFIELCTFENRAKAMQWTKNEENKLLNLVKLYGGEWKTISNNLPNRSPTACKQKFYSMLRPNIPASKIEVNL
ncbi:Homeodomain-like DNA binding domain-containing transcription factor [Gigaspora margarita]|uniref:Homeodomain-like DNA binding domain-containing transcription factor n=1 Tax=Gigaspora margarita TaxID=4874 RepID=A0A8H3X0Y7_GIGMA|nr:Homeodomain-like DNA binding domain-containing transcription factor [Gigaspora margarita]